MQSPQALSPAPVGLATLPPELVERIVEFVVSHEGLASLTQSCRSLRAHLLSTDGRGSSLLERTLDALVAARGWIYGTGFRSDEESGPVLNLWPSTLKAFYARRVNAYPSPFFAWPLTTFGRVLRVGPSGPFASVRAALLVSRDGDTVLLSPGAFDEGNEPLILSHSIRLVGSTSSHDSLPPRKMGSTLCGYVVATQGRGSICGVMLCMPEPAPPTHDADPQQPTVGSAELARCFAVTGEAVWTLEDCRTVGGVRVGSRSELMCVNCTLTRDRRRPHRDHRDSRAEEEGHGGRRM